MGHDDSVTDAQIVPLVKIQIRLEIGKEAFALGRRVLCSLHRIDLAFCNHRAGERVAAKLFGNTRTHKSRFSSAWIS
jgi:hypothetical protein